MFQHGTHCHETNIKDSLLSEGTGSDGLLRLHAAYSEAVQMSTPYLLSVTNTISQKYETTSLSRGWTSMAHMKRLHLVRFPTVQRAQCALIPLVSPTADQMAVNITCHLYYTLHSNLSPRSPTYS